MKRFNFLKFNRYLFLGLVLATVSGISVASQRGQLVDFYSVQSVQDRSERKAIPPKGKGQRKVIFSRQSKALQKLGTQTKKTNFVDLLNKAASKYKPVNRENIAEIGRPVRPRTRTLILKSGETEKLNKRSAIRDLRRRVFPGTQSGMRDPSRKKKDLTAEGVAEKRQALTAIEKRHLASAFSKRLPLINSKNNNRNYVNAPPGTIGVASKVIGKLPARLNKIVSGGLPSPKAQRKSSPTKGPRPRGGDGINWKFDDSESVYLSSDDYVNNMDEWLPRYYAPEGTEYIKAYFNYFDMESNYDYVEIHDEFGLCATVTGFHEEYTSALCRGDYLDFRVRTDSSVSGDSKDGFLISGFYVGTSAANSPPVAIASASDYSVYTGETIRFDGLSSYDPDGEDADLYYHWDFGDGTEFEGSRAEAGVVDKTYERSGTFAVTLTVWDDYDDWDADELTSVYVYRHPVPTAYLSVAPDVVETWGDVTASGYLSSPSPHVYYQSIAWGDGSRDSSYNINDAFVYQYDYEGDFLVTLYVENYDGDSDTDAKWVSVYDPPTITSISPDHGAPFSIFNVYGTKLWAVDRVWLGDLIANFTKVDNRQIRVTVPSNALSGAVTVQNVADSYDVSGAVFHVDPVISDFSPRSGKVESTVRLTGRNLDVVSEVYFGSVRARSFQRVSSNEVTAVVPLEAADSSRIRVVTPWAEAETLFDFNVTPRITSLNPSSGLLETAMRIVGDHFNLTLHSVEFGGVRAATFNKLSNTEISAVVPENAVSGPVTLRFSSVTEASPQTFTVIVPAPTVTALAPTTGTAGTQVTIEGTNFYQVQSVSLNGINGTFTRDSKTRIRFAIPFGAGSGTVSVRTPGGTANAPSPFTVTYETPTISGFDPSSGIVGTTVTISGTGLDGINGVSFGGAAAQTFSVQANGTVRAQVPADAVDGPIGLSNSVGSAVSANAFKVRPRVSGISPTTAVRGTSVTITGDHLSNITGVYFQGVVASAEFTSHSSTSLSAVVPEGAQTGAVRVVAANGEATSPSLTVQPRAPEVSSFTPARGPVGAAVTLTGKNFENVQEVKFSARLASFTVNSATEIRAIVPSGARTGPISVTNVTGTGASTTSFAVDYAAPTITSIAPVKGPWGTRVKVKGANLNSTEFVIMNGANPVTPVLAGATLVEFSVQTGAETGPITLDTLGGRVTSRQKFKVTFARPSITSISPSRVSVGQTLTINGNNLNSTYEVIVGGVVATFEIMSNRQVVVREVPVGAQDRKRVKLRTRGGVAQSSQVLRIQ